MASAIRDPDSPLRAILAALLLAAVSSSCRRAPAPPRARPAAEAPGGARQEAAAPPASAKPASSAYALTPAETAALENFLRQNPSLRAATDADRHGSSEGDSDIRNLYGVYHPYFVRGDVNDDGVLDFTMAFVRRDQGAASSTPWFSTVVFLGRRGPGGSPAFSSGTFIERDVTLTRGDLSIDRDSIVITPDTEEDTVRRYRWDSRTHAFVFVGDADDDSVDSPSVSRTSRRAAEAAPAVDF